MERHKSAIKAARQAEKRRAANHSAMSAVRTAVKKFETTLAALPKDRAEAEKLMMPLFDGLQKTLMKAGSKRLIQPQTASRKIGRLAKRLHGALAAAK